MPAVGSQMLSDVSSEIRRYVGSENGYGAHHHNALRSSSHFTSDGVVPTTEITELTSASRDVSPKSPVRDSKSKMKSDTISKDNMYLEGGPSMPGGRGILDDDDKITMLEKVQQAERIWFRPEMDRQTAESCLRDVDVGLFIVRPSSLPRTLALSVKIPSQLTPSATAQVPSSAAVVENSPGESIIKCYRVEHYLIENAGHQFSLEGSDVAFSALPALVEYYAQNRNELPVSLRLPSMIQEAETRQRLSAVLLQLTTDFWKSYTNNLSKRDTPELPQPSSTAPSSPTTNSAANVSSMLPDSATESPSSIQESPSPTKVKFPHNSAFDRKLRSSRWFPSESTSGNYHEDDLATTVPVVESSRASSYGKSSDYEDIWSLAGTKSPDYAMSDPEMSSDRSMELPESDSSAKAVGLALRDLDALGDWIESELHDQRLHPQAVVVVKHKVSGLVTSSEKSAAEFNEHHYPGVVPPMPIQEEMRVIRRGKRRFAGATAATSRNRFSAPNLSVNVDDLLPEDLENGEEELGVDSIYSSVHDLSETHLEPKDAVLPTSKSPDRGSDDFVCYTPPRKCMPSKDQNIIESFQSKVVALKRIGSKLLSRKSSLKTSTSSIPKNNSGSDLSKMQERVMVFRTKKPSYDSCWPVDNGNWSVTNQSTPTTSSGTSSSTGSATASAERFLTVRSSSKSPAETLPKRSKTLNELDPSRDLEREISLERTVSYVVKNSRADFVLTSQLADFLLRFAAVPAENLDELFEDLEMYMNSVRTYIMREHRADLEDFISRDFLGESGVERSRLETYVDVALQRLIVEPLCMKLVWNLQAKLGVSGDLARLEKGCQVIDTSAAELTADDVKPEIHSAVIEKLSAITAHFKNFAEAQNLFAKGKQLFTVFSDIFGIEASPLDYCFLDLISAFAVAIVRSKSYSVEIHLDFIWQLLPSDSLHLPTYFPVLLAASCATTALKKLGNDSKQHLGEAILECLIPACVNIQSRDDSPVISRNLQVPLDKRLSGSHLTQLMGAMCSSIVPVDSELTLQVTAGCLGIVHSKATVVKPAFDRWRTLIPDCILTLLVQTKTAEEE